MIFSDPHTSLNMGKRFSLFRLTDPKYGKDFLCFPVCTQILNMEKVFFFLVCSQILNMGKVFSGLHADPENMGKVFFVFLSAHRS